MYYLLANKMNKRLDRQVVHLKDATDRTFCQLENVRRRRPLKFLELEDAGGRSICKPCRTIMEQRKEAAQRAAQRLAPPQRKPGKRKRRFIRVDPLTRMFRQIIGPPPRP